MVNTPGPCVLAPYGDEAAIATAAALCVRYSDAPDNTEADVACQHQNRSVTIKARAIPKDKSERWII
jgi:hypothetical protein